MTDHMRAMEVQMEKQVLKYAVQRLIFCPVCDCVMDMRKVASITCTPQAAPGEVAHTVVLCVACFDATRERVAAALQTAHGTVTMTTMDARDLYRTRRTKAAAQ